LNWQTIKKSELVKNTSILVSGTALAQLIPILLQPLLRRFYTPETFGTYSVYLSLIGILYVLSSLRYEMAIALPKKDKTAINLWALAAIFNLCFNALLFILILIFKKEILQFLNIPAAYSLLIFLVPVGNFLYSFYQSTHYWLIRKKSFKAVSVNKFARRISEGTVQITVKNVLTKTGLVLGDITGHFANAIAGYYQSTRKGLQINQISIPKLKYVFKKYAEFPKYNLLSSFMGVFSFLIPTLLINKFYSAEYAGYYDLSKMVLSIPLALIAGSVANVLLQRFSEKRQMKESIFKEFFQIFIIVFLIAVLEIIVIRLWGVPLFKIIFGKQWVESGIMSQILVWSYAINFIVFSFSSVFISLEKIKTLSAWQALRFLAILVLFTFNDIAFLWFIKIYVLIEIFSFIVNLGLLIWIIYQYEKKLRVVNT
jgi:O-antigen/teichoic acid export membrane protein